MEYIEFRFKNFKGIGDMTLPLTHGRVTTLIGLNESGKTTILEAIFCFSYGAENLDVIDPSMASLREPERWIPIALRSNFNDTIEISAKVRLSDKDKQDYRKHMRSKFGLHLTEIPETIGITESYSFENSRHVPGGTSRSWKLSVYGTKGQQRNARQYPGNKNPEWIDAVEYFKARLPRIWYFPNFLFELPDRFVLETEQTPDATEETDKSAFYRLTFERILKGLGSGANLETHVVERAKSLEKADQRNLKSLLLEMGRDVTKTVVDGWNRIFGRDPIAQDVELDADVDEHGIAYLELKIKGPDGYYDLSERSLGFRWFFMFLLMTSYRSRASESEDVVFLLDEPASNLHSSAQAELLKSFETLAETCHLIYTTHSHHMINIKWLDSAFVVKNDALGDFSLHDYLTARTAARTAISASRYRTFVSQNPSKTSYFQPVLDLLEYRPSNLEPVPDVVLVEGKSDFYLLKYAIDLLGLVPDLRLIPGGGAGSLDPLIRLHIGWGKKFLILLDADAEGSKQRARYEREFGPILQGRYRLLSDVCGDEGVREIEDLFTLQDRERFVDSVYAPGVARPVRKKALNHAVIEMYARKEPVELLPETTERLANVLKSLHEALEALQ